MQLLQTIASASLPVKLLIAVVWLALSVAAYFAWFGKKDGELGVRAPIILRLNPQLQGMDLKFGLLHVRDGKDEVKDSGPLLNKEIAFHEIDRRGTLQAVVVYPENIGFQFKCFVDIKGNDFEKVKKALEDNGFTEISQGGGKASRIWFILPEYKTYKTVDGLLDNFYYPS
jgi:hypothetical protein